MKIKNLNPKYLLILTVLFFSCQENYTPKPRGYFRIDLPDKTYQNLDSTGFPYSFHYPKYAFLSNDPYNPKQKYWLNINFPAFNATVHISYRRINNNLADILNDAHTLVAQHISKADAIYDSLIIKPKQKVYGVVFNIEGVSVASPYQFYVTDSTQHYLRGALYFNTHPNNDSLKPVIEFLKTDIDTLLNSLKWNY